MFSVGIDDFVVKKLNMANDLTDTKLVNNVHIRHCHTNA